ncbi:MAG: hypothetical protein GX918_05765 [Clostridiales bacterium]|jgi:hypothetical protein|nr:hypothetical protein [Clostridiales bacterium]
MSENRSNTEPGFALKIERLIIRAAVIGMIVLMVFQFVMLNDTARVFLNYATTLEGGPLEETQMHVKVGSVYVMLENEDPMPEAKLLLNGEPAGAFNRREIQVNVRNNDVLELDASMYDDEFVHICIVGISDKVELPRVGQRVKAKNRIELISRVKLK